MTSLNTSAQPEWLSNSDQSGALLLTLIPSTLVVLFTPVYLYHNLRRVFHAQNARPWWKLITAVSLLATELQSCMLSQLPPDKLLIVATCVYLGFVCLLVLLYLEHQQVFQPSGLLAACLFVHVLFDAVKAQSMLSHLHKITPSLVSASFQRVILILLETSFWETSASETQANTVPRRRELPTDQHRFKLNGTYQKIDDLPALDDDIAIKQLRDKLSAEWDTVNRKRRYCLQLASFRAFPHLFVHTIFLRTCLTTAVFSQPLLMKYVLHVAEIEDVSLDTTATIFALTVLVFGGVAISRSYFTYSMTRLSLSVRGAVSAIAMEKVMLIQDSSDESSSAVTILSNNLHALETHVKLGIELAGAVVDTVIGQVLLYNLIGPSSLASIIPLMVHIFFIKKRNPTSRRLHQELEAASESWILSMSHSFSQLKDMKMAGSISTALLSVKSRFATAIDRFKDRTNFWITSHMIHGFLESCVPLIVLGTSLISNPSDEAAGSNTFPSLALATLLIVPMMQLQIMCPDFFTTMSSIHRIREFLLFPERVEYRVFKNTLQHGEKRRGITRNDEPESPNQCPDYITFSGLCVSSRDQLKETLQKIEGQIRQSQLSMVVGPVGWGKSTLLKAILGEANQVHGSVTLPQNHRIAYCGQTPWLPNTTIRNAIIGAHAFDAVRYHRMVQACDLERDLEILEFGDESWTGSGGTLLSGGQKQRISLARALYADAPIVVLDDIFSALDRVTARRIFGRLFSKDGLLRRSQVTTVMSTHAIEYLSEADQIFLAGPHGTLQSHGSFFDVEASPAATEAILHSENFATDEADWDTSDLHNQVVAQESHITALAKANENRPPATARWSVYHFFIQFVPRGYMFLHFLFSMAVVMLQAVPAIFAPFWIADNMEASSYFLVYVAANTVHPIFHAGMYIYYLRAREITRQRLFTKLISIVLQADIASLTRLDRGTLISRFVEDLVLARRFIDHIMKAWFFGIALLIDMALLPLLDTAFAIALPVFLLMLLIIRTRYVGVSRQLMLLNLESKAAVYTQVTEVISGLTYLRAFQWQPYYTNACFEKLDAWQKTSYFASSVQRWCLLSLELAIVAAILLVVNFATSTSSAKSHTAAIATAMFILMNISLKLSDVVGSWVGLEMDMSGLSRIQTFIETTTTEPGWQVRESQIPANWPSQGSVELSGVSAGYSTFGGEMRPILKDISFKLRPGNKIGVIGRTGSGKTSLALTILNSLPFEGQLIIDNVDVSTLPPETVRRRITIITQNPVELLGTVRDNLIPSQDDIEWQGKADDLAIHDALRRVGLSEYIEEHGGLDALFSDMDFSQGQKQLICLARAILHNSVTRSRLVIIDEATSSMDYDTDSDMQKVISDSFIDCTIIVIAHRVESLKNVDYLLELEDGRQVSLIPCSERARLSEATEHTD